MEASGSSAESLPQSTPTPQPTESDDVNSGQQANILQVDAREYPWLYMTKSLEKCFENPNEPKTDHPAQQPQNVNNSEDSNSADEPSQSEEGAREPSPEVEFHSQLEGDKLVSTGPSVLQAFLSHEKLSTEAEKDALRLAATPFDPDDPSVSSEVFDAMVNRLELLIREAKELEESLSLLLAEARPDLEAEEDLFSLLLARMQAEEAPPVEGKTEDKEFGRGMLLHMFMSTLPVLRTRKANLTMATELVHGAKESWSMEHHLRDMNLEEQVEEVVDGVKKL